VRLRAVSAICRKLTLPSVLFCLCRSAASHWQVCLVVQIAPRATVRWMAIQPLLGAHAPPATSVFFFEAAQAAIDATLPLDLPSFEALQISMLQLFGLITSCGVHWGGIGLQLAAVTHMMYALGLVSRQSLSLAACTAQALNCAGSGADHRHAARRGLNAHRLRECFEPSDSA